MPFAHQRWINGLQSVPDAFGRPALLAWSYDGRVCLWDAQTGANIAAIEHERVVEHAAWIADVNGQSAILSSSAYARHVRLTVLPHCDVVDFNTPGYTSSFMQALWVPELLGRPCVLCWQYRHGVTLWDAASGEELKFRPAMVWGAAWSTELRSVLYWSNRAEQDTAWPERNIALWTPETDECRVYQFPGHIEFPIFDADGRLNRHSGDGAMLVSSGLQAPAVLGWSSNGLVGLWDALTTQAIAPFIRHHAPVLGASWVADTPCGPAILSWSLDGRVMLCPISTGRPFLSASLDGAAKGAAYVAAMEPCILAWSDRGDLQLCSRIENDAASMAQFKHARSIGGATWLSNVSGRPAILSWADDSTVRLARAATGNVICSFGLDERPTALILLPSQQPDAVSFAVGCRSGSIGVFDFVDR
ncbi:MAG: WD40 repeat domain-containing protein [Hyphomicrobiales bacterium]|nr:MAG: WD40 repeat domain-containing protein [Hyphomicrobiales bacterium]